MFLFVGWLLVRVIILSIRGRDFSNKIAEGYRHLPGLHDKDAVDCAKVKRSFSTYILKIAPNAIASNIVMDFRFSALASMGVGFDGIDVYSHPDKTGYYFVVLSKLKKRQDERGRDVADISVEDFPKIHRTRIAAFLGFPYKIVENELSRYCFWLGYNGRFILHNDMAEMHFLFNGPTNKGKTGALLWFLYQKYLKNWPHFGIMANPVGGAMDFLGAEYAPVDMAEKPEEMARGDWVKQFDKMPNFLIVDEMEVFTRTVEELDAEINYRKAVLTKFDCEDIYQLADCKAFQKDSYFAGRRLPVITLIIEDLTALQTFAAGKKRLEKTIKRALDLTTYSRKVGVHVYVLAQISTKAKLEVREMFQKLAFWMNPLEMSWYLGASVECPRVLGSFMTSVDMQVEGMVFPRVTAKMLGDAIYADLLETHPDTVQEEQDFATRVFEIANPNEELEKTITGQIRFLLEGKKDDEPFAKAA